MSALWLFLFGLSMWGGEGTACGTLLPPAIDVVVKQGSILTAASAQPPAPTTTPAISAISDPFPAPWVQAPSTPSGPATDAGSPVSVNPFADFDFEGGSAYPRQAKIRISSVEVAPGSAVAHVPISLDRPTPNTVIARVRTRNGTGEDYAYEGHNFDRVDTYVIFRPGDPLIQTVRIPLRRLSVGDDFALHFPEGVVGAESAQSQGTITVVDGAAASVAQTSGFRAPRRFAPSGLLTYQMEPRTVQWSDEGSAQMWSTRLPHGRSQPGNAETGLYLDPLLHLPPRPSIAVENGEIVLRSQQLGSPIKYGGRFWQHGAAVLTGERVRATHLMYGQYEWEARMPNRRGSWPALWLLPTSGWPPEIDVYEGFGYADDWNFRQDISANLHGGAGDQRTFTTPLRVNGKKSYGIDNLDSEYHRYAIDIAPDYITWFIDGYEVYQAVNPFRGTNWFPLMNVAVKHDGNYTGGSGEMRVRAFSAWNAR